MHPFLPGPVNLEIFLNLRNISLATKSGIIFVFVW